MAQPPRLAGTEVKRSHTGDRPLWSNPRHVIARTAACRLVAAPVAYGWSQTPRPSSIEASLHAPNNGVERTGIGKSAPHTTNASTRFVFAPDTLGGKLVDGTIRVSDHGEAKVLRGDEVKSTGDLRGQSPP
jgi:hypothetical protein